MLRDCEWKHIVENNYVFTENNLVCVTLKLWSEFMKDENNSNLIDTLRIKQSNE